MLTYLNNPIKIAVGDSRRSTKWRNQDWQWPEFAERLRVPQRTAESYDEYNALPKAKRDDIKDVGGFVGGLLKAGRRKAENVISRQLLTLDLDEVPEGQDPWEMVELVLGCAAVLYSTHSHKEDAPRLRLIIPLSRPVSPDEYTALARRIAGDIGIDMCDDTTYEPHRLMYWPSVSWDASYRYERLDAPWLNVDEQLARYHDWQDSSEWPVSSRKQDVIQRLAKKQGNPTTKPGLVGAFCRVYSVDDAILEFLPAVYVPCDIENRYTFIGGSTSAGLVIYENGLFAYSHHGTDPVSGKLCNAFDLVRIHLYGDLDDNALPETRGNRLPSYLALVDLLKENEEVKKNLAETRLKEIADAFDDANEYENEDRDWLKLLSMNTKGAIESTIDNALIVLQHDPRLKGRYYYDEFRERPTVCGDLPWQKFDERLSDCWADSDDAGLRLHLEKYYNVDSIAKIRDAVELAMLTNKKHPVRNYLEKLTWDSVPRVSSLFIDYLGADDTEYVREVTARSLIGAVARVFEPGCKHDHALVLVGPQGTMKSTTLNRLGGKWFSDSLYTITGKDAYEQLQGYWIIELSEMAAMRKAELEQIKHFISKQTDSYRAAYARRTAEHPRQCAFFGSTNDAEFLRDATGNRRFWPITVTTKGRETIGRLTQNEVDQIWAEVVCLYRAGERWYLSERVEALACEIQAEYTETNSKLGLIEGFLKNLLPSDWEKRDVSDRLLFWDGGFGEKEEGVMLRTKVCALELWVELFRGQAKDFGYAQSREITGLIRQLPGWMSVTSGSCGPYKKQRMFIRKEPDSTLD